MIIQESIRANNLVNSTTSITIELDNVIETKAWTGSVNSNINQYFILKNRLNPTSTLKIIYVLPVEYTGESSFGNGLIEVKQLMDAGDIQDNILFVSPDFIDTPWFCNHSSDVNIQQEDNIVELIDDIQAEYTALGFPNIETYLLGFSKSGHGSMNLLMKYPSKVDGIMIWDTPLSVYTFVYADMAPVFGTLANLQNNYYLNDTLVANNTNLLGKDIIIGGYNLFETYTDNFTAVLDTYPAIDYTLDETMNYAHAWNDVWIKELFAYLGGILI